MISQVPVPIWSQANDLDVDLSSGEFERVPVFLWGNDGHTGYRALRLRIGLTQDFIAHLAPDERTNFGVTASLEPNGFAVDDGLAKIGGNLNRRECCSQ